MIIEAAAEGVLVVDEAGTIIEANPAAHSLFGYDPGRLAGLSVEALVPATRRARHKAARRAAAASPGSTPMSGRTPLAARRHDGSTIEVGISLIPVVEDGRRLTAAIITDLSRESALRRALQKRDATRDQILAALSHELRTPVTVINGLLTIMAGHDEIDEETVERSTAAIRRQARRLADIMDDLTILAAVSLDSAKPRLQPAVVRNLLVDAVTRAGDRHDVSAVRLDAPADLLVDLDARLMAICVSHLVANAVGHGHPPVLVSAALRDGALVLGVQDHGDGLAYDQDVFAPMSWGRHDLAKPGLGLGLAVVTKAVEAHGGFVSIASGPQVGGTNVELYLPARNARRAKLRLGASLA